MFCFLVRFQNSKTQNTKQKTKHTHTKHKTHTTKHKTQNIKHTPQNTKHKTQNTKHTPHTDTQTQHTHTDAPCAKQSLLFQSVDFAADGSPKNCGAVTDLTVVVTKLFSRRHDRPQEPGPCCQNATSESSECPCELTMSIHVSIRVIAGHRLWRWMEPKGGLSVGRQILLTALLGSTWIYLGYLGSLVDTGTETVPSKRKYSSKLH